MYHKSVQKYIRWHFSMTSCNRYFYSHTLIFIRLIIGNLIPLTILRFVIETWFSYAEHCWLLVWYVTSFSKVFSLLKSTFVTITTITVRANTIYPPLDLRSNNGPAPEQQNDQDKKPGNDYAALQPRKVLKKCSNNNHET